MSQISENLRRHLMHLNFLFELEGVKSLDLVLIYHLEALFVIIILVEQWLPDLDLLL